MSASRPPTTSPSRVTISRSTPCVDGWLGPKLIVIRSSPGGGSILLGAPEGMRAGEPRGTTGGGSVVAGRSGGDRRGGARRDAAGPLLLGGAHLASVNCTGSPPIG